MRTAGDGEGKTFEWDAANRLSAINSGGQRSEFTYDGLSRRVKIVEKSGSTVTSTKQFVWLGNRIAQERNASNVITRSYFAEGEERGNPGAKGTKQYYYSRDHLGSIREMTSSSGALQARYDYDPYGQRTKLTGAPDVDFGYTGHYFHAPGGLNLSLYRAYNPTLG
jgi:YD repeat-containing protein